MKLVRFIFILAVGLAAQMSNLSAHPADGNTGLEALEGHSNVLQVPRSNLHCIDGQLYAAFDCYMLQLESAQRTEGGDYMCQIASEWEPARCPEGHLMRHKWAAGCIQPGLPVLGASVTAIRLRVGSPTLEKCAR